MPMILKRRPRSTRRITNTVRSEVRKSLKVLGQVSTQTLQDEVNFFSRVPDFETKVRIGTKVWSFRLDVVKDEQGKKYLWVSEGTGTYGAGKGAYDIFPEGQALTFELPSEAFSESPEFGPSASTQAPPGIVITGAIIDHPGIPPRNFGDELYIHLKSRRPGSVHNVIEAAIKRAFRRQGII